MQRHREVVLLLGAPGAGKGTQARFIGETLGVPHVASGDLLREHRRQGTDLGRAAQAYMDRGDLVPDELVIDMVTDRLQRYDAERGALLDGFPRTRTQAEALRESLAEHDGKVSAVIYLAVPKTALVERLAGRWMCTGCQATYHEQFQPPTTPGQCNICSAALHQRPDDQLEVVENRVEVYLRDTKPLIDYYEAQDVLHTIDGHQGIESVRANLCAALGGVVHGLRRSRWHLFLSHADAFSADHVPWLGRTLCGKYVAQNDGRAQGTALDFEREPCRECGRTLRVGAALQTPTPLSTMSRTNGALSSTA